MNPHTLTSPPLHAQVNASIGLPDLPRCKTMARPRPDLLFDRTDVTFKAEIKPGCRLPYAGFPSLFVLPVPGAALKPIKLNCFGSDSRYSTLVLSLPQQVCVSLICIFQKKYYIAEACTASLSYSLSFAI